MKRAQNYRHYLAVSVALITFVLYLPALQNEFVDWDDGPYVFENPHIRSLDLPFFRWAFCAFHAANWHPLTWISHAVDYALWGLTPLGHHLTNNILHAVNAFIVVFLVIKLLDAYRKRTPGQEKPTFLNERSTLIAAGATGLLFGIHPVHVESVVWVAERKDLLCTVFFLLGVIAYIKYASTASDTETQGKTFSRYFDKHYLAALGFFILALLSKPMAVSLPLVLLTLDWYPFRRIRSLKTFRAALIEKLPFISLSLGSSVLTILAQRAGGTIQSLELVPFSARLPVGAESLILYLWKIIWPLNLVPYYPYPGDVSLLSFRYLLTIVLVTAITITSLVVAKKQRLWLSVWGYYVATLLPALGVIQVGGQSMADRYLYLPGLGPFLVMGLGAAWISAEVDTLKRWRLGVTYACAVTSIVVIISVSYLTVKQTGVWKNSIVRWDYILKKEPVRIPFAYYGRGLAFDKAGQFDKAIIDYNKAIALNPSYYEAYNNRGLAFDKTGQFDRAIADYDRAIALNPSHYEAYNNRGLAFDKSGQFDRAIADFDRAIVLNPSYYQAYYNRGTVFYKTSQFDRAIADFDRAIALNPSYYEAYCNRGAVFYKTSQFERAIGDFDRAIALNPSYYQAYYNRGLAFDKAGRLDKAAKDFDEASALQQLQ